MAEEYLLMFSMSTVFLWPWRPGFKCQYLRRDGRVCTL